MKAVLAYIWARVTEEPALVTGILTAALNLWVSFGHVVSQEQQGALLAFTGILLAFFVRGRSIPTSGLEVDEPDPAPVPAEVG